MTAERAPHTMQSAQRLKRGWPGVRSEGGAGGGRSRQCAGLSGATHGPSTLVVQGLGLCPSAPRVLHTCWLLSQHLVGQPGVVLR